MTNNFQNDLWSIRKMSQVFQITPRTLRFYEEKELLFPLRQGQMRLFGRQDRARLKLILRGKRFGFALEDIRQILNMYALTDGNARQLECVVGAGEIRLAELEQQQTELQKSIDELKKYLAWGKDELQKSRPTSAPIAHFHKETFHASVHSAN